MKATSGAKAELVTTGLYRYSRNPQYVADMAILVGFVLVTSAWFAIPVAAAGVLALAVAPFAEEPWLKQSYGEDFETYRSSTRRYF
jgi:protein-S-isoprenylcysteine O-methyltransferase Ste14